MSILIASINPKRLRCSIEVSRKTLSTIVFQITSSPKVKRMDVLISRTIGHCLSNYIFIRVNIKITSIYSWVVIKPLKVPEVLQSVFAFMKAKVSIGVCIAPGADIALFIVDINLWEKSVEISLGLCIIFVKTDIFPYCSTLSLAFKAVKIQCIIIESSNCICFSKSAYWPLPNNWSFIILTTLDLLQFSIIIASSWYHVSHWNWKPPSSIAAAKSLQSSLGLCRPGI